MWKKIRKQIKKLDINLMIKDIGKSIFILSITTLIGIFFQNQDLKEANIITIYILGVLITAVITSYRFFAIMTAGISVILFNFFFTMPKYTLQVYDTGYQITYYIMFISAFVTGSLAIKIKKQANNSAKNAEQTKILFETSQMLQKAEGQEEMMVTTSNQLVRLLERTIIFYKINETVLLEPFICLSPLETETKEEYTTEEEKEIVEQIFQDTIQEKEGNVNKKSSKCIYFIIKSKYHIYGIVGIAIRKDNLNSFEHTMILSILGECALVFEKELFNRKREEATMQAEKEKMRANLLRSISHDLRTPLTSISGNAGVLLNNGDTIHEAKKKQLYIDIYDDAMWLIDLVENLLFTTRIEDGVMNIQMEVELVEEVIAEALRHVDRKSVQHNIIVKQPEELILAKMDSKLIIQVIINIVNNAIKYTPIGSKIVISTIKQENQVIIEIKDNGNGIAPEQKETLFDVFFLKKSKVPDGHRGLGIGLALCKSIISAHNGTIIVKDNIPHGSIFQFTLQAEEVILNE